MLDFFFSTHGEPGPLMTSEIISGYVLLGSEKRRCNVQVCVQKRGELAGRNCTLIRHV
jgi:hypothetical protein